MSNSQVIILSPETQEEHDDLIAVMELMGKDYVLYHKKHYTSLRYLNKILDIVVFLYFIFKYRKISNVILGVPNIKNRIASCIFKRKFVCYLRTIYTSADNFPYLSDKIDFWLKKVKINHILTNPYKAHYHLITSRITESFLIKRQAIIHGVYNIGAVWLNDIHIKANGEKRIFFITQAFEYHGLVDAQNDQRELVINLSKLLKERGENLILKIHPRDKDDYTDYTFFEGDSYNFLSELSKQDVVISFFSTLAFEVSAIGGNVKFVSFGTISDIYNDLYKAYNIDFLSIIEMNGLYSFLCSEPSKYKLFNPLDVVNIKEAFDLW